MRIYFFTLLSFFVWAPLLTHAKVVINEVAWMGSADDANAEWLELYNDGAAVELTGWLLSAIDGQPAIALEGTIESQAYFLLERTGDDTVPSVAADEVYTGALGNNGEILELRDANNALVDRVDGSDEWAIGGDNALKYTLQRTQGRWVTAEPTPKQPNHVADDSAVTVPAVTVPEGSAQANSTSDTTHESTAHVSTHTTKQKEITLPPSPEPTLSLDAGPDTIVPVNVPHVWRADVRKEGGKELRTNLVSWNFGDGVTATGKRVEHAYRYPGDYVVTVHAERPLFRPPLNAEDRFVVHAIPLSLTISHADMHYVELTNESTYELDLTSFTLAAGTTYFLLPDATIILPHATVRFSAPVTKLVVLNATIVGLFTPSGVLVATSSAVVAQHGTTNHVAESSSTTAVYAASSTTNGQVTTAAFSGPRTDTVSGNPAPVATNPQVALVAQAYDGVDDTERGEPTFAWYVVGLATIIMTALVAVFLIRREQVAGQEVIEGFEIDSDE